MVKLTVDVRKIKQTTLYAKICVSRHFYIF